MAPKGERARTVVVPESFFDALGVRLLKDFGTNSAENLLYEIGRDAGTTFARDAERTRRAGIRTEAGVRKLLQTFSREWRWAEIDAKVLDVPGKYAVVEWRNGVGVPRGGSRTPVCHLGRGLLSGAAEVVFGEDCDAIETKCQAMGADHCEIVVGVRSRVAQVAERIE